MGHWNYRFCVERLDEEDVWTVREVYYDDEGRAHSFTAGPAHAQGSSFLECADDLSRMSEGLSGPAYRIEGNTITEMARGERFKVRR